jgi:hypothetical protein
VFRVPKLPLENAVAKKLPLRSAAGQKECTFNTQRVAKRKLRGSSVPKRKLGNEERLGTRKD